MIINSILDTDWYKLTMGQVVHFFFPGVKVRYKFIDRNDITFPEGFDKLVQEEVNKMKDLKLTANEAEWLSKNPIIYSSYLNFLFNYQFNSDEVKISQKDGKLDIIIEGEWEKTIYWEVPLLAIISELYYRNHKLDFKEFVSKTRNKTNFLADVPFIEFGTRRRFSHKIQNALNLLCKNKIYFHNYLGTSNPHFAMKYNIPVIGTYAHEAVMALEIIETPSVANWAWLFKWKVLYGKQSNIALSDTLTTDFFLKEMQPIWANLIDGIRQDSGDPIEIGWKIINRWSELGITPKSKKIIFSDNLTPEKAKNIYETFKDVTNPIFGIGTNLTNDCGYEPLNIVIKMSDVYWGGRSQFKKEEIIWEWMPVVKLSDNKNKYTGDLNIINNLKNKLKV